MDYFEKYKIFSNTGVLLQREGKSLMGRDKRHVGNSPQGTAEDDYRTKGAARSRRDPSCQEA